MIKITIHVFLGNGDALGKRGHKEMASILCDEEQIAAFCHRHHIRKLAFFGSVLRTDFGADSDIDILVEFMPGSAPGLFGIARMERELGRLFNGRKVDLRTKEDLSRYFRQTVVETAEVAYVQ